MDPFSGTEHGQLRVRLAVGTSTQIESLHFSGNLSADWEDGPRSAREKDSGWQALDLIQWPDQRPNNDQSKNQNGILLPACHTFFVVPMF